MTTLVITGVLFLLLAIGFIFSGKLSRPDIFSSLAGRIKAHNNIKPVILPHDQPDNQNRTNQKKAYPVFRILRVNEGTDNVTIYFANDGGKIFNVQAKTEEGFQIKIEPSHELTDSGCLKFYHPSEKPYYFPFTLSWSDERQNQQEKMYRYLPRKKIIIDYL